MAGRSDVCGYGTSFESRRWISLDPCGLVCVSFSFFVHIYATVINGLFLITNQLFAQLFYGLVYIPLTVLAVSSLCMAWRTDPGAVPMGSRPLTMLKKSSSSISNSSSNSTTNLNSNKKKKQRATRRCPKCNDNYKPPRAHHDSVTGRCVVKFDHYCPWVGNAVGAKNHKFFCLFVFYTMLTCLCTIFLTVLRCIRCGYVVQDHESSYDGTQKTEQETHWDAPKNKREDPDRFLGADGPDDEHFHYKYPECEGLYSNVFVLVLAIVALAFLIFTCSMLLDQIDAITSNTSKIARMKMKIGQGGTELERVSHDFNEMFGGDSPRPAWHWFLPLSVRFPSDMEQVVLGYDWDPTYEGEPFQEDDMVAALESKEETLAVGGPPPRDIDIECGKIVAEEDGSVSDESESFHNTAAKKRSGKKEDNPTFVGSTKNRLT